MLAGELIDGGLLAFAKALFTFEIEDQRDIGAGVLFDNAVADIEGYLQHARKLPADRGYTGPHWADQEDIGEFCGVHKKCAGQGAAHFIRLPPWLRGDSNRERIDNVA